MQYLGIEPMTYVLANTITYVIPYVILVFSIYYDYDIYYYYDYDYDYEYVVILGIESMSVLANTITYVIPYVILVLRLNNEDSTYVISYAVSGN
jgi:hypothetical protein